MIIRAKLGDTLWWSNIRSKSTREDTRARHDTLIAFHRSYHRTKRTYIYRFTFFRFTIGVIF